MLMKILPIVHLPSGAKGRGGGRRNTKLAKGSSSDRNRGMSPILGKKVKIPNSSGATTGITTIDRRPGRPSFHHMGPLPNIPPTIRQPDSKTRVSIPAIPNNNSLRLNEKFERPLHILYCIYILSSFHF